MKFILRAQDKEGNVMFYTGCAGMKWLANDRSYAFQWNTMEAAEWKAQHFNKWEPVHGYRFSMVATVQS